MRTNRDQDESGLLQNLPLQLVKDIAIGLRDQRPVDHSPDLEAVLEQSLVLGPERADTAILNEMLAWWQNDKELLEM